jgi:hypothetical protein
MIHVLHGDLVERYFAGDAGPRATRKMFDRIWICAACRARYERQLLFERVRPDGRERRERRMWGSVTSAAAAPARAAAAVWSPIRAAVLVASLAVAAIVVAPRRSAAPVARGGSGVVTPSLHLYRTRSGQSEEVRGEIRSDDGVLVAYSNPSDLGYLMVFAVDTNGDVHWYYPAYERPGEDPAAVPIRTQAFGVELGEEIRHTLPAGDLRMFALFLPAPMHVAEAETMIGQEFLRANRSVRALTSVPVSSGDQTSILLTVRP